MGVYMNHVKHPKTGAECSMRLRWRADGTPEWETDDGVIVKDEDIEPYDKFPDGLALLAGLMYLVFICVALFGGK
jgi:hypothetical protein